MKNVWMWRGNHFDGKLGSWQACHGFKPSSRFGGNEYVELVPRWQLDLANETIQRMQTQIFELHAKLEHNG